MVSPPTIFYPISGPIYTSCLAPRHVLSYYTSCLAPRHVLSTVLSSSRAFLIYTSCLAPRLVLSSYTSWPIYTSYLALHHVLTLRPIHLKFLSNSTTCYIWKKHVWTWAAASVFNFKKKKQAPKPKPKPKHLSVLMKQENETSFGLLVLFTLAEDCHL